MSPETKSGRSTNNPNLFNQRSNSNNFSSRESNGRDFKSTAVNSDDVLGIYLKEVSSVPLLTAQQEVDLFKRIERGRKASILLYENEVEGEVSPKRQGKLSSLIEDGIAARDHLLTANRRLVISIAKIYVGRGVDFKDLIQEGNIGMIRAARKFDYHRGLKFSTYSTWWIRQAVSRAVAEHGRTIRIPVHMSDQINRMIRISNRLTQFLGRDPTSHELAEALEVPSEKIENMIQIARRPISLETPTDKDENSELGDFIDDEKAQDPPKEVVENQLAQQIRSALRNELPYKEKRTLELRYGLQDGNFYTLHEIGQKLGVSRERARQLEVQALRRLRNPKLLHKLKDYTRD